MSAPSQAEVGAALATAGHYRVIRAQQLAGVGPPDGISGALLLSLGLRETWLHNIQGGAKLDVTGRWVPLGPEDADLMDVGALQISRRWHADTLAKLPGVKSGTWGPVIPGRSPAEYGYVPRWTESIEFTLREFHESIAYAADHGVPPEDRVRFAVAAHNAGLGGALNGWRAGNVDRNTAHGDYSAWVLQARTAVNAWLHQHPNWLIT